MPDDYTPPTEAELADYKLTAQTEGGLSEYRSLRLIWALREALAIKAEAKHAYGHVTDLQRIERDQKARIAALEADGKRDYDGMREFQLKFIAADLRVCELEANAKARHEGPLSSYAFNNYGGDAALYNGIHDLEADKRRLDWLEGQMPITLMRYRESESECIGDMVQAGEPGYVGKTLRAAIDSAGKEPG